MQEQEDAASLVSMTRQSILWQLAGSSIVLWDHATTFDQEIEFIWLGKWTFTTSLYIVTRYVGDGMFIHGASMYGSSSTVPKVDWSRQCMFQMQGRTVTKAYPYGRFFYHQVSESLPGAIMAESNCPACYELCITSSDLPSPCPRANHRHSRTGIVVKRVVCMYGGDKRVLWVLAFALAVATLHLAIVVILTSDFKTMVQKIPSANVHEACYITPTDPFPSWYWTWVISTLIFEIVVLGLCILQGIWFACENRPTHRNGRRRGILEHLWRTRRTLASVLLRDSILFPFLNLLVAILTVLLWLGKLPASSIDFISFAANTSVPVIGCRLLLNLRSAYYKAFREEYRQSQFQDRTMGFPNWFSESIR
ncbi:hypothetical protein BKA70DRAFT_1407922 [Coprinopsis sp. MPI-PUGE-AT-0042]|nr:hypothetical protein BKA70DRAFT_1407922 [Coprinopsis sp. MPI-PUGE-AT-0042]